MSEKNFWEDAPIAEPAKKPEPNFWEQASIADVVAPVVPQPLAPPVETPVLNDVDRAVLRQPILPLLTGQKQPPLGKPSVRPARLGDTVVKPAFDFTEGKTGAVNDAFTRAWEGETQADLIGDLSSNMAEQARILSDPDYASKGPGIFNPGQQRNGGAAWNGMGGINWTVPVVTPSPSERLAVLQASRKNIIAKLRETKAILDNAQGSTQGMEDFKKAEGGWDTAGTLAVNLFPIIAQGAAESSVVSAKAAVAGAATAALAGLTGGSSLVVQGAGLLGGALMTGMESYDSKLMESLIEYGNKTGVDILSDPEGWYKAAMKDPKNFEKVYNETNIQAARVGLTEGAATGVLGGLNKFIPGGEKLVSKLLIGGLKGAGEEMGTLFATNTVEGKENTLKDYALAGTLGATLDAGGDAFTTGVGKLFTGSTPAAAPVAPAPAPPPPAPAAPAPAPAPLVPGAGVVPPVAAPAAPAAGPVAPVEAAPVQPVADLKQMEVDVGLARDAEEQAAKRLEAVAGQEFPDEQLLARMQAELADASATFQAAELAFKQEQERQLAPQPVAPRQPAPVAPATAAPANRSTSPGSNPPPAPIAPTDQAEPASQPGNVPPAPVPLTYATNGKNVTVQENMAWMASMREWEEKYGKTHNQDGTPLSAAPVAPAAPAKSASSFTAGLREDAAKLRGQRPAVPPTPAATATIPPAAPVATANVPPAPPVAAAANEPAAPATPPRTAAPSPQPTPAPGANRASFDPQADPRWENLYRDQQKKIRELTAERDNVSQRRDRESRQGRSTKQSEKRLNTINTQIEEVLAQSQPRPEPVARPARQPAAPVAPVAGVPVDEPAAPVEPEGIVKAKAEAAALKDQLDKLEASGQGRTPQATKLRNRFNERKQDITRYENKNKLPLTYPPQARVAGSTSATASNDPVWEATQFGNEEDVSLRALAEGLDSVENYRQNQRPKSAAEKQLKGLIAAAERRFPGIVERVTSKENLSKQPTPYNNDTKESVMAEPHRLANLLLKEVNKSRFRGEAQANTQAEPVAEAKPVSEEQAPVAPAVEEDYPIDRFEAALKEDGIKILRRNNTDDFEAEGGVNDNGRLRPTIVVGDTKITLSSDGMGVVNGKVTMMDEADEDSSGNVIYNIERIVTIGEKRGSGSASKALAVVTAAADKAGLTLQLEPTPFKSLIGKGQSLAKAQLIAWYKKNGFKQKTPGSDLILVREPNAVSEAKPVAEDEDAIRGDIESKIEELESAVEKYARRSRGPQSTIIPYANELVIATARIALRIAKTKGGLDFLTATAGMAERYKLTPTQLKKAYEDAKTLIKKKSTETLVSVRDFVTKNLPGFKEGSKEISTRTPSKSGLEDPLRTPVVVGLQSTLDSPKLLTRNINLIREYPNMRVVDGETEEQTARRFIEHVKSNLLWLYNQVPANIRERSKLWYEGANKIANQWADQYGHKPEAVAGVLAALSPQKDWYENVHLAEAVLKVWNEQQDNVASPKMLKALNSIEALSRFKNLKKVLATTKFKDLDIEKQALFTRLWSEAHTDRTHFVVTPEGGFDGKVLNDDKVTEAKAGWLGLDHVEKAINCLRDQSVDNISLQMGGQHKVRNFYNNIIAPGSDMGHVTIDTHAVAAGLLRALAGESLEVGHNLGSGYGFTEKGVEKPLPNVYQGRDSVHPDLPGSPGSDAVIGVNGTYGLYAEAYRQAAAEVGVLPREMQSITWEAIRGMYESTFKANAKNVDAIDAVWEDYRNGKLEIDEVREKLNNLGGGITPPTWYKRGDQDAQGGGSSANQGELPSSGVPRENTNPLDSGTRSKPASGNPRAAVTPAGDVANHGDADLARRGFITNEATQMPADLAGVKLVIEQDGDVNENPNNEGFYKGKMMLNGKEIAEFTYDNRSYSGGDDTKLDWVKVVPKHRNKGLSKVIQAEVIERAKRLKNPSKTFSMTVVDPKSRPTKGLQSLLGEDNVNDNGPDYAEAERGDPFAFKDPDNGEWITKTNEVTATIPNQYTPEQRQLIQNIKDAVAAGADEKTILGHIDAWAKSTLPPGRLLSFGPQEFAALAWQTGRTSIAALGSFAQWSKQMVQTYGPKVKSFLKQIWIDSKAIRQNAFDFATVRYLASRADKIWQNADRNPQSPTLRKLANLLHTKDGTEATGELSSIPQRIREERIKFANAFARISEQFASEFLKMDKAARQQWDEDFRDYVLGNKKPTDPKVAKAVAEYRQLMGELLAFQRDAGIEMGDQGGNYFPRVYSPEAIDADLPGFLEAATEMYRQRDARLGNPIKSDAEYASLANAWAFRIQNGNVDQVQLNSAAMPEQSEMPSSTKSREFTEDEAALADKYLSKDIERITLSYIGRATKAAEVARAFGPKGEKFTAMIAQLGQDKVPMDTIEETAGLVRRTLGYGIERHSKAAAAVIDWSNAVVAAGFLGFSFVNNVLLEPVSYGVRTGNPLLGLRAVAETWAGTIRVLSRGDLINKPVKALFGTRVAMAEAFNEAMAEQLGLLQREMEHSFMDAHWNYMEEKGSPAARWVIQRVQKANLMQQTEHAKVAASVGIARLAVRDNVRFMMGQAPIQKFFKKLGMDVTAPGSSKIILNENGVPEAEHQAFAEFVMGLEGKNDAAYQAAIMSNDRMAFLYRQAIQRMSNGMSIKANQALKMDSSDKLEGKMMMQLMNYSYAYANLVKDAMYNKAMAAGTGSRSQITMLDRARLAVPLLVGGTLSVIAAEAGKQLINEIWPTEGTEKREELPWWRKILDSASYAGMFGPKVEFVAKLVNRGQFPVGPSLDAGGKTLAAAGGMVADSDSAQRSAKKQIYNAGVKPVVVGGASAVHPFLGFMANQAMRQESVRDAFIGEKPQ